MEYDDEIATDCHIDSRDRPSCPECGMPFSRNILDATHDEWFQECDCEEE